ncbi:MAG TPA: DUF11 domain-containing protein [Solirubrobacteraceae bacterium]|jgi:uncharacterized repeat protein (TIGR01451 family)|nr:DUF11 domain-containing protein [Solirubrobacteraceae bacterium]
MQGIITMLSRRGALVLAAAIGLLGSAGPASTAQAASTAQLSLTKTAPATATVGSPFDYVIKVTDQGPAQSTATMVTDQLPANTKLVGFNHSQGTCSSSGSPAKVTCTPGTVAGGSSATVTIAVTATKAGSITNTATATNAESASTSASATTKVAAAPAAGTVPQATTGGVQAVTTTGAKLLGTVVPGNQPTGFFFEIGMTKSYGAMSPIGHTGTSKMSVSSVASRLTPATIYHYRLVAINDSGTSYGADRTFTTPGSRSPGALVLDSKKLHVRHGRVYAPFTCNSTKACRFRWTIAIRARSAKTHKIATAAFTKSTTGGKTIRAHTTVLESAAVQPKALALLGKAKHHRLTGKLTARPRSGQKGISKGVTVILG